MTLRRFARLAAPLALAALAGCGAAPPSMEPGAPVVAAAPAAPAPLDRSYFARESGAIGEDQLQKVLSTPIDLVFPARVGVVPVAQAFASDGDVDVAQRTTASMHFAERLRGFEPYSHVSDVSTDLPNAGGIEGLRAIAARYRLRYLLLVSQRFEDDTHVNGWAALYPTIIGIFVTPSVTVASRGVLQADLLDVRTGTILFSTIEPMHVDVDTFAVGADRTHRTEQVIAARDAAERLARRVKVQTGELLAYAEQARDAQAEVRLLPAPIRDVTATAPGG